jgi:SAM-dependent methyltransferase
LLVSHVDAPGGISHVFQCARCGLRRLNPRPSQTIIGSYYKTGYNAFVGRTRGPFKQRVWNWLRDANALPAGSQLGWLRPLFGPLAEWAFDINVPLNGQTGLRVMELGCGYGDLLIYLKSRGCEVQGVDFDSRAAEKGGEYGVPIHVGSLAELRLPAASFDVGIMCHSLEHVPDPAAELSEFARILKPGGRLHIAVPNGGAVGLRLEGAEWMHLSHPLHFWFFDAVTLVSLLDQQGFSPLQPPYSTSRTHYLGVWRRRTRETGFLDASRALISFLKKSWVTPDGGDVLCLVAVKR